MSREEVIALLEALVAEADQYLATVQANNEGKE